MNEARVRGETTEFFEELYAVVVGLGLAVGVEQVLDLERSGVPVDLERVPLFLAYLNFAFALAHGSVRYLQLAYAHTALGPLGKGRVVADLALGIGHFLWLIVLSFLIGRPSAFLCVAAVLLIGRPLRDLALSLGGRPVLDFDRKIAIAHLLAITAILGTLAVGLAFSGAAELSVLRWGGFLASLVFGLSTYLLAFDFFFPRGEAAHL